MDDVTKQVLSSISAVVILLAGFCLGRWSRKHEENSKQFVQELNKLIDLVTDVGRTFEDHQSGKLSGFSSYKKSREAATMKRKGTGQLHIRLCQMLAKQGQKDQWQAKHLAWVAAITGDTGLITETANVWEASEIAVLEQATTDYCAWLTQFRGQAISKPSKVLSCG